MVDKKIAKMFLNKYVSIERTIVYMTSNGQFVDRVFFSKGNVTHVNNATLVLKFNGTLQAYDLDTIKSIREVAT